ncbi:MAG: serine/threonine protein kinase [Verrucomicrobiaceae bacterium]|nr:serine/threonine protein kinase [Verrucomicrobiaceae bacterium]
MSDSQPPEDDIAPLLRIGLDDDVDPDATILVTAPTPRTGSSTAGGARGWQPPTLEELQHMLPQYEISAFIARGGMGAVYKGAQKTLKRPVAIKVLPPDLEDGDLQFAARFKHEAQAMAQLSHPNIVAVFDAGEAPGGLLYFVMEYIEGTDVAQLIASEGIIEPRRAIQITTAVCEALAFAHEEGIIHRDIKPSNIMLDRRGRVKVADFGLAKTVNVETALLTGTHMAMGTPDFIAPEALIRGMKVDQRADIYAVGVMLYQMLTGHIPRSRFELPSGVIPQMDKGFDAIVDKAMQTDREKRYSTALEMKTDVERVGSSGFSPSLVGSSGFSPSGSVLPDGLKPERRTRSRKPLLLGVAATLIIGTIAWLFLNEPSEAEGISSPSPQASQSPSLPVSPSPTSAPDRAAALRVLERGGTVMISTRAGATQNVTDSTALPEGTFTLEQVVLHIKSGSKSRFMDADMALFTGLPKLRRIVLSETQITGAALAVLKSLPALKEVALDRNKALRDDDLKHLSGCPLLEAVTLHHPEMFTAGVMEHLSALRQLTKLEIGELAIGSAEVKHLLRLTNLRSLSVSGIPLRAGDLEQLQALPGLQAIIVSLAQLERPMSFASFPSLTKIAVGDALTSDAVKSLATATKLETLNINEPGRLEAAIFTEIASTLKNLKSLTLTLDQPLPPGEPLAALAALPKLEKVNLGMFSGINQFDDAALLSLAKVTTLKGFQMGNQSHRVTAQGIAAFQKLRPDVKIEGTGLAAAQSGPLSPPVSQSARLSDRDAALKVLAKGASVTIRTAVGAAQKVTAAAALPAEAFVVEEVETGPQAKAFDDAAMAALAGLPKLTSVRLRETSVTGKGLQVVTTLPSLRSLRLDWNTALKDSDLTLLRQCPLLEEFSLWHPEMFTPAVLEHVSHLTELTKLDLLDFPLRAADFRPLQLRKLEILAVGGTPMDAATLEQLRQLPALLELRLTMPQGGGRLDFSGFPKLKRVGLAEGITVGIVESLAAVRLLERLTINTPGKLDPAVISQIAKSLKGLTTLLLTLDQPLTGSAPLSELASLPKLVEVTLGNPTGVNQFDDAALLSLEGVASLKTLNIDTLKHRMTREGIADFQKRRPDVKIKGMGLAAAQSGSLNPPVSKSSSFPPGQWVKPWKSLEDIPDVGIISEGWATLTASTAVANPPGAQGRNWGIRVWLRGQTSGTFKSPHLQLRHLEHAAYKVRVLNGAVVISRVDGDKKPDVELKRTPLKMPAPGQDCLLEFIAIGQTLHAKLNGEIVSLELPANEQPQRQGGVLIYGLNQQPFRDIEAINLDGLSETEALKLAGIAPEPSLSVSKSPAPAFPPGQWVKPFAQFSDIHDNWTKAGTTWDDGWITPGSGTNQSITLAAPNGSGKNWGVRARYRWAEHGTATLVLRRGGTAAANNVAAYELRVDAKSTGFRRTQANGAGAAVNFTPQGEPAPVKLTAGDEVLVEAFAIDGTLHGRVNGQAFQATSDGVLEQGSFEAASMQMSYRDIEFINLDGLSEAEALKAAGVEKR